MKKMNKTHYQMFPFYIYNLSINNQEIQKPIAGGNLFLILEAKDKNNEWKPIEYFEQFGFLCGTCHQDYLLEPKNFIVGGITKYIVDFSTVMRIKLKSFNQIFYSNIFKGKINYSQFEKENIINEVKERFSHKGEERLKTMKKWLFLE